MLFLLLLMLFLWLLHEIMQWARRKKKVSVCVDFFCRVSIFPFHSYPPIMRRPCYFLLFRRAKAEAELCSRSLRVQEAAVQEELAKLDEQQRELDGRASV